MWRKLRRKFGMDSCQSEVDALRELELLIGRSKPLNTIEQILNATQMTNSNVKDLDNAIVCLDTNIFFHLANSGRRVQVVDYLASQFEGPIIVSGQAMQEVWNNYLSGVDTIAENIRKNLEGLSGVVESLETGFSDYKRRFEELLREFRDDFGHLHRDGVKDHIRKLLDFLRGRATFCEVPRSIFEKYYRVRKETKTPPGFKDRGAGDYYVWLDFLYGMKLAKNDGQNFRRSILITDDRKPDWVRGGVPHPTLSAECSSYVGSVLEIHSLRWLEEATKES